MSETATERIERLEEWRDRLYRLLDEMERVNGDPPQGGSPPKLECLTRFAAEEADEQVVRAARLEAFIVEIDPASL